MADKKNFWNNWDFKTILQIGLILGGFIVGYIKLEARVEFNKILQDNENKNIIKLIETEFKNLNEKLDKIENEFLKHLQK